jgi:hypothetical protein
MTTPMDMHEIPEDWSPEQKALFTRLLVHMLRCQDVFVHPEAPFVESAHWQTTAFNAAWTAALFMNPDTLPLEHITAETGEIFSVELTKEKFQ